MRKLFIMIVLGVLVAGCGGGTEGLATSDETATAAAGATQTSALESAPAASPSPEATSGPSLTPQPSPTLSPTPGPTPTGGAKWIAFSIVKRALGAYESQGIFRMAVDGSALEQIVEPGFTLLGVSPSGLRLLASAGQSLYVMGIDASNQRLLTDRLYDLGSDSAYWTSDEHRIIFIAGDGVDNAVYVAHPDTSEVTRISQEGRNPIELYPTLDSSGVFWSAGTCTTKGDCSRDDLMWSSINGAVERTLREGINRPAASPAGDSIIYPTTDSLGRGRFEIAALDGSGAEAIYVFGSHYLDYGWSPTGNQLAVIVADRSDYSGILTGYRHYVVDSLTGVVSELPWMLGENTNLTWSPDGSQIVFSGTGQTDTSFEISMHVYDLMQEQQLDVQDWEVFSSQEYVFIPCAYWIP